MKLLDRLTVRQGPHTKEISLYQGDLTALPPEEAVDVLVVSAFPDTYTEAPGTLIAALRVKGVSVGALAQDKLIDLRETHSCWLSRDVVAGPPATARGILGTLGNLIGRGPSAAPALGFRRILCFEPQVRGLPTDVVGDIFRCLAAVVLEEGRPLKVAMPLVACGVAGCPVADMLNALLEAAAHWMALEFPLTDLKIVIKDPGQAAEAHTAFARFKQRPASAAPAGAAPAAADAGGFDVFVSYSRKNADAARVVIEELGRLRPGLRLFYDQLSIQPGAAWQQDLYEAVERCGTFVPLFSPDYLNSKVCLEEFHLAKFCNRESGAASLVPLYVYTARLPAYMRLINYLDCREGDEGRLRAACARLLPANTP